MAATRCLVAADCSHCSLAECYPVYGCPDCGSSHVIRYGHSYCGTQNWMCRDCGRKFVESNRTKHKKYGRDVIKEAIGRLKAGESTYQVHDALKGDYLALSLSTVYRWGLLGRVSFAGRKGYRGVDVLQPK